MSDESKTPEFNKLVSVKVPTTRAILATHNPELLPGQLDGGYTWDNANAPLFVGPFVSMVDAGKAFARDIAAIEERHAEATKQSRREAYEDAIKGLIVIKYALKDGVTAQDVQSIIDELREKAVK